MEKRKKKEKKRRGTTVTDWHLISNRSLIAFYDKRSKMCKLADKLQMNFEFFIFVNRKRERKWTFNLKKCYFIEIIRSDRNQLVDLFVGLVKTSNRFVSFRLGFSQVRISHVICICWWNYSDFDIDINEYYLFRAYMLWIKCMLIHKQTICNLVR